MKQIMHDPRIEGLKQAARVLLSETLGFLTGIGALLLVEFVQKLLGEYIVHLDKLQEKTILVFIVSYTVKYVVTYLDKFKHVEGKNQAYDPVMKKHVKTGESYGLLPL